MYGIKFLLSISLGNDQYKIERALSIQLLGLFSRKAFHLRPNPMPRPDKRLKNNEISDVRKTGVENTPKEK